MYRSLKKRNSQGEFSSSEERFSMLELQNRELRKELKRSVNYGSELLNSNRDLQSLVDEMKVTIVKSKYEAAQLKISNDIRCASFEEDLSNLKCEKYELLFKNQEIQRINEKLKNEVRVLEDNFNKVMNNNSSLRKERRKKQSKSKILNRKLSQMELEKEELDFQVHNLQKQNSLGLIIVDRNKEKKNKIDEFLEDTTKTFNRRRSISFSGNDLGNFLSGIEKKDITFIPTPNKKRKRKVEKSDCRDLRYRFSQFRDFIKITRKGIESDINMFRFRFKKEMNKIILKEMRRYLNCDIIDEQKETIEALQQKMQQREIKFAQNQVNLLQQLGVFDLYQKV